MALSDDDRGDLRAGTWGAGVIGGLITLGLLAYGQFLLVLVALPVLLVTIWVCRIVLAGLMYPLASTAARIVTLAAGEEPYEPRSSQQFTSRPPPPANPNSAKPAYTVVVRCGCGAAMEVNALIPADTQRATLTPFFEAHQACMARALAHEPGMAPMTSTITCVCGQQLTVDVAFTPSEEMKRLSDAFIDEHRRCGAMATPSAHP